MSTPKKSICFYFQVHQPYRLREISFFEDDPQNIFHGPPNYENEAIFNKVADKCYLPATKLFLQLAETNPDFRVAYSLSGVFLEQCEQYPEKGKQVLELFARLAKPDDVNFWQKHITIRFRISLVNKNLQNRYICK
jgi:alpha-amylase